MATRLCWIFPLVLLASPVPAGAEDGIRVEEIAFASHGARLSGSLVLPQDGKIHAAVVFIHGSGKQSRNLHWGQRFARAGIAALVYDKRGAGRSGGEIGRASWRERG